MLERASVHGASETERAGAIDARGHALCASAQSWPLMRLVAVGLMLVIISGLVFFLFPTRSGLVNWQESQRLVVAREMQAAGELVIPTLNGTPYLSKPPVIYWAQMGLAKIAGSQIELIHLRLAVALAGVLGVLLTWLACRRMVVSEASAVWAGVMLATGILYVRSSRIGELDIYLVPGVVLCGWMAFEGIVLTRGAGLLRRIGLIVAGSAGAVVAGLAKGPPGLAMCGVVTIGVCVVWAGRGAVQAKQSRFERSATWLVALVLAAASAWASGRQAESIGDWLGVGVFVLLALAVGHALGRLPQPAILKNFVELAWRSGGVIMLIIGQLAFAMWGYAVTQRLGPEVWGRFAKEEAGDNLHLLVPESPIVNIEAIVYGAGLGSVVAIATLVWMWRAGVRGVSHESGVIDQSGSDDATSDRRRLGLVWLIVWVIGGVCVFSFAGKGVARYLTPLWPGLAMLGGFGLAMMIERLRAQSFGRIGPSLVVMMVIASLGIGQIAHYAQRSDRDPGAMVRELQSRYSVKSDEIFTMEFRTPALDYYAQRTVYGFGNLQIRPAIAGFEPMPLETIAQVASRQRVILLTRDIATNEQPTGTPIERLQRMGLQVKQLPLEARFEIDSGRASVMAVEVGK